MSFTSLCNLVMSMLFFLYFFFLFFSFFFFFFNDTATTEIYTLSLHDALPISGKRAILTRLLANENLPANRARSVGERSEEHTSELQSRRDLVCRLLLEKKKKKKKIQKKNIKK